jgi:hypothetical protein
VKSNLFAIRLRKRDTGSHILYMSCIARSSIVHDTIRAPML